MPCITCIGTVSLTATADSFSRICIEIPTLDDTDPKFRGIYKMEVYGNTELPPGPPAQEITTLFPDQHAGRKQHQVKDEQQNYSCQYWGPAVSVCGGIRRMVSVQNSHQEVLHDMERGKSFSLRMKQFLEMRGSPNPIFPILGNPASSLPSHRGGSTSWWERVSSFLHIRVLDSAVLTPGAL